MASMPRLRCQYCEGLSLSRLIALAKQEYGSGVMPEQAFYQHHASLNDLENSATNGCDLCCLVLESLKCTGCEPGYDKVWSAPVCQLEESRFTRMKDLATTDIKLCITSSCLYGSDSLDSVRVLDSILVHIGPVPLRDASPKSFDDEWALDPMALTMTVPRDEKIMFDNYQIGRFRLDPDLGSQFNFNLARSWLRTCMNHHSGCPHIENAGLPARVIDVGPNEQPHILRVIDPKGMSSPYVALSHCWGGPISQCLTTKTMHAYREQIPFQHLPANFRDAIYITRQLGIRYLWIDSLCILQDSKRDWELESRKMGSYYRDSTVTILALTSKSSSQGILKPSLSLSKCMSAKLRVYTETAEDTSVLLERITREDEDLSILGSGSGAPLTSRAWTLQEYWLSPRHLCYSDRQIYWRCPSGFDSGEGFTHGRRIPDDGLSSLTHLIYELTTIDILNNSLNINGILHDYYKLICDYSERLLTEDSDKLPAISGLVQLIQRVLPGKYLAGLWDFDFHRGLNWYKGKRTCMHVRPYRAPSWSWAVTNDCIIYNTEEFRSDIFRLQLVHYDFKYKDNDNCYGEVETASILLTGFTRRLILSSQVSGSIGSIGSVNFDEFEVGFIDGRLHSYGLYHIITEDECCFLSACENFGEEDWNIDTDAYLPGDYVAMLIGIIDSDQGDHFQSAQGLVLRKVEESHEDQYERIGQWTLMTPKLTWIESWERQTLKLI
ncbi:HET-domain-containing protein [Camillea tinctor]|nr:HET-domain-containing protein [Camillea tinctor]